jgi:hypothetical protein
MLLCEQGNVLLLWACSAKCYGAEDSSANGKLHCRG